MPVRAVFIPRTVTATSPPSSHNINVLLAPVGAAGNPPAPWKTTCCQRGVGRRSGEKRLGFMSFLPVKPLLEGRQKSYTEQVTFIAQKSPKVSTGCF